ncbi:hypothetical protein UTI89_C2978 [Escherichia coli UTI89]|uniref:Uncharacterized protein n=1 Tax=Escherichia coli (strain UTI89 / UPEC) TaxID=364106 RepID=Q1R880_ECOUT|nr:hypothetical protein UTI89_C2978 [Escherichia coli UTI89]
MTLPTFAQLRTLQQQKAPRPVQIALTFHPVHTVTADHLIISGNPPAVTNGDVMGDGVPGLRGFLPGGGTGLDNLRPCPERNQVLRLHAKVIRGHIHPQADQDAFIQFTGVRQNVGCAGLRLTNFHCGKYLYGPTSQPKLCGMSSFSTSVTDERFS